VAAGPVALPAAAVLDANVVAAWTFVETNSAIAQKVGALVRAGSLEPVVPWLFWSELQHICRKKWSPPSSLPRAQVALSYAAVQALPLVVIGDMKELRDDAWGLVRRLDVGSYDACYLALAVLLDVPLWTFDNDLWRRAQSDADTAARVQRVGIDVVL
jgi:predicted nucleic acid-binding protein